MSNELIKVGSFCSSRGANQQRQLIREQVERRTVTMSIDENLPSQNIDQRFQLEIIRELCFFLFDSLTFRVYIESFAAESVLFVLELTGRIESGAEVPGIVHSNLIVNSFDILDRTVGLSAVLRVSSGREELSCTSPQAIFILLQRGFSPFGFLSPEGSRTSQGISMTNESGVLALVGRSLIVKAWPA